MKGRSGRIRPPARLQHLRAEEIDGAFGSTTRSRGSSTPPSSVSKRTVTSGHPVSRAWSKSARSAASPANSSFLARDDRSCFINRDSLWPTRGMAILGSARANCPTCACRHVAIDTETYDAGLRPVAAQRGRGATDRSAASRSPGAKATNSTPDIFLAPSRQRELRPRRRHPLAEDTIAAGVKFIT